MFSKEDYTQIVNKGLTIEQVEHQLKLFSEGFPFLDLEAAASVENGIVVPSSSDIEFYIDRWDNYRNEGHSIIKFVPASGAASRMFKDLFAFMEADYTSPTTPFEIAFFDNIKQFAFFSQLNNKSLELFGESIESLLQSNRHKEIVRLLLTNVGLNYGALPKGLLTFHKYGSHTRTPLEEHLSEGAMYASSIDGDVNLHFTVSPEHRELFQELADKSTSLLAEDNRVKFHISFSEQKPSTDTIAVDSNSQPFRDENGALLFRPGGHGALIENLNDLTSDIVFIKNIDNVVPDYFKPDTVTYKKVLAGILVTLQSEIFEYLRVLDSGEYNDNILQQIAEFIEKRLFCSFDAIDTLSREELIEYLYSKLNRPIRVCGMVRNVGEPGGGPFLARNSDNSISLQILESSQIDMSDERKREMFVKGTHFNPVDLVCGIKNYRGEKFNLPDYVDPSTGFISSKSKSGRELKALELPGLWNGAMSNWNTIFVEVPLTTFNPVKTVNDLLRSEHQPE